MVTRRKSRAEEILEREDAEEVADADDEDDTSETTDSGDGQDADEGATDDEQVKDPVAKAVAAAEAKLRHTHIKPLKAELARLKQEASNTEAVVETVRSLRMENEFLRLAGGTFHDASAAFKLADVSHVQIADDGKVTGVEEAIEAVVESHPYLVRSEALDDDDDFDYRPEELTRSGRPTNRKKGTNAAKADNATLLRKYPALRRR